MSNRKQKLDLCISGDTEKQTSNVQSRGEKKKRGSLSINITTNHWKKKEKPE